MPHVVHSHVQQVVAQCDIEYVAQVNVLQSQINNLEADIYSMFGSMSGEEMQNLVQTVNELKAQMAQMIKQYQPAVPVPPTESWI